MFNKTENLKSQTKRTEKKSTFFQKSTFKRVNHYKIFAKATLRDLLTTATIISIFSRAYSQDVAKVDLTRHFDTDKVNIVKIDTNSYEWSISDGKTQTLHFDLKHAGIDPSKYDEFRFNIKPLGSQVALHTQIEGFPTKDAQSSWYLKFKTNTGQFSEGRYDLNVDDDGIYLKRSKTLPDNTLVFSLARRILGTPGEVTWRKAVIQNPRFVRYPVKVEFDLTDCVISDEGDEISYSYKLTLQNRTYKQQTVSVDPDSTGRLKYFSVSAPTRVNMEADSTKTITIEIKISKMTALSLPPLYSERIYPKFHIEGIVDSDVVPVMGFRRWPLWGTVPIFNKVSWSPATMRAFLDARKKILPQIDKWEQSIVKNADTALLYDWPIPSDILPAHDQSYRAPGGHNYLQPVNPIKFHHHRDPDSGKIFDNVEQLDRSYVQRYYSLLGKHVYNCSIAYLITDEEKYLTKAVKILTDLANAYDKMPCAGMRSTSGGSKLGSSTLLGSYILPKLAEGFSFISNSPSFNEVDKKKVINFLNKEAARLIRHSTEYTNQTAEHLRAYGTTGIATGFWPFTGEAIYGEFGWHEMVEYAFSEDGIGHEAGGYHRSIFWAMNEFATFAYAQHINLFTARFKRVYDGSIVSGVSGIDYETAYRVYRDPGFLGKLTKDREKHTGINLALHGILGLAAPDKIKLSSANMSTSGYLFLRKGDISNSMELRLNYLKPFDRTELDRFTTFIYKNGQQVDNTTGRISYSSDRAHWMYSTASHNTIVIDGKNEMDVDGALIAYNPDVAFPAAIVSTAKDNPFYTGVQQIRCIALVDNVYVVFDYITSNKAHTFDRYQHGRGDKAVFTPSTSATVAPIPVLPEYAEFTNIQNTGKTHTLDIAFKNTLKMRLVSDKEFRGFKAVGVSGYQALPAEITFARAENTQNVSFLAGFVFGKDAALPDLKIIKADRNGFSLEITTASGRYSLKGDIVKKMVSVKKQEKSVIPNKVK